MLRMTINKVKGNKVDYIRKKYSMLFNLNEFDYRIVDLSLRNDLLNNEQPTIINRSEWPKLESEKLELAESYIKRFIKEVNEKSPLIEGEVLISDTATVIKARYGDIVPGTPILWRETSLATLYYFRTDISVDEAGNIKLREIPMPAILSDLEKLSEDLPQDSPAAVALFMEFLKGLVGGMGSEFGAAAVKVFLPDKDRTIDFDELKKSLELSVKGALAENTISEQEGIINGLHTKIITWYLDRKEAGEKKENLFHYLNDYHDKISDSIGILKQDNFKEKGLATFMIAATLELALYQEMALVDPIAATPLESSTLGTLTRQAENYCKYVRDLVNKIIKDNVQSRLLQISDVKEFIIHSYPYNVYYYFADSLTGTEYTGREEGCDPHPREDCQYQHDVYVDKIQKNETQTHTNALQWMLDVTTKWSDLVKKPLPIVVPPKVIQWNESLFKQTLQNNCGVEYSIIAGKIIEWAQSTNTSGFTLEILWDQQSFFCLYSHSIDFRVFSLSVWGQVNFDKYFLTSSPLFFFLNEELQEEINSALDEIKMLWPGLSSGNIEPQRDLSIFLDDHQKLDKFFQKLPRLIDLLITASKKFGR